MKVKLFSVYDEKALCYKHPQFYPTSGDAIRAFTLAVNNKENDLGQFPEDFTLYEIGVYDDQTAQFESLQNPANLGKGNTYVRNQNT